MRRGKNLEACEGSDRNNTLKKCPNEFATFRYTKNPRAYLQRSRTITNGESAACHLGDSEAVFQHLKTDNLTIGDGEHDGEGRLNNFAGSLEFGRERTKNHCSVVAG